MGLVSFGFLVTSVTSEAATGTNWHRTIHPYTSHIERQFSEIEKQLKSDAAALKKAEQELLKEKSEWSIIKSGAGDTGVKDYREHMFNQKIRALENKIRKLRERPKPSYSKLLTKWNELPLKEKEKQWNHCSQMHKELNESYAKLHEVVTEDERSHDSTDKYKFTRSHILSTEDLMMKAHLFFGNVKNERFGYTPDIEHLACGELLRPGNELTIPEDALKRVPRITSPSHLSLDKLREGISALPERFKKIQEAFRELVNKQPEIPLR